MIRRFRRSKEQPAHADDWLITYADMITLLLCFFVVFIIVSTHKKNVQQKAQIKQIVEQPQQLAVQPPPVPPVVQPPIQSPIKVPDIFQGNMPFHDIAESDDDADQPASVVAPVIANVAPAKAEEPPPVSTETLTAAMAEIAEDLKTETPIHPDPKGDRITTLEMNSAAFFDSGQAILSEAGKTILRDVVLTKLKSAPFRDYQITVEGHTDDTPIHTAQFPSNWELSTARASAVVHYLLDQGIPAQKLRAAGYADTFPKVPNRDANGNAIPGNQAQNRRVVIKLEKIEKNQTSE